MAAARLHILSMLPRPLQQSFAASYLAHAYPVPLE